MPQVLPATTDIDATTTLWFSPFFNKKGFYDTLFSNKDQKEALTPYRTMSCPTTTLPPCTDFLSFLEHFINYSLWTLSRSITETPHSLHIYSINTFYLFPINTSLHSCALSFWTVTVYLQSQLFIICSFNYHIISSLSFSKDTDSFFPQLKVHFHSLVYRFLVLP